MTASMPAPLVRPFTVAIPNSEIDDLKQRLARTRWPNPETVPDWSQGVRLENTKSLINYWEQESGCDAPDLDARVARIDRRVPETDWPAH